jgi:uncharacterized metal-binding protein YceD (DUF177 family)
MMERLVEYIIPFKGLSLGKHEYDFSIDDAFFKSKETNLVERGKLEVKMVLDKEPRLMTAYLKIQGALELICDRCLEAFDYPIEVEYQQIYKFGDRPDNLEDDLIYLDENEHLLDVSELILENVLLEIPIKRVHFDLKDGSYGCNPVILKSMQKHLVKKEIDPRWEGLKDIKLED